MRDETDSVLACGPCDAAFFADAADFGDIGLNDVKGARLEEWLKALAAREDFSARDGDGRVFAQFDEVFEGIGNEGFLEPVDIVVGEHFRRIEGPAIAIGPVRVAASCVHHEAIFRANSFSCGSHDGFICCRVATSKGPPTDFEGAKALSFHGEQVVFEAFWFVHQQRGVRLNAFFVATAEKAADGLAGGFPEDVPEGDVDPADGVGDGAAASEPEHVLMELFADAFWFERVFATVKRFEDCEGRGNERVVGEHAAEAGDTFVGVDGDESVNAIFGAEFVGPSAFGGCASEACATDFSDFHKIQWVNGERRYVSVWV